MRYLMSVIDDGTNVETEEEVAAQMAATGAFNEQLRADGHWVFADGLAAPATATVVDARGEQTLVSDGPFLETKEYLAGFWVVEAADLDVALALAAGGSRSCHRRVEVRPFATLDADA